MSGDWGPLLAIRADAGHTSGIGHVMRTLAIAQEWQQRGGRVVYLSAAMPAGLSERLEASGIRIEKVDTQTDADSTAEAANRLKCAVLLVDHYALADDWWRTLPARRRWRTAAINDFAAPIHPLAEILISPRVVSLGNDVSGRRVSGPAYFLIRSEVRRTGDVRPVEASARRILLILGGSDPRNVGPAVAKWLLRGEDDWTVRVVVGPAATNRPDFDALAKIDSRLEIVERPETMGPHFEWADTAVASPSTTVFEALHHGLVTGLVLTADNQREIAAGLVDQGCASLLGDAREDGYTLDARVWFELSRQPDVRTNLSTKGAALVDGGGAGRVCDLLGLPDISFRNATEADSRLLWDWANDPLTRAASFSSAPIPWEEHESWFRRRLAQSDPVYLAIDGRQTPLGVVRFDRRDGDVAVVSYNLAPVARGKDLSTLILGCACALFRREYPRSLVHAWIKNDNLASQRCFVRAGFRESPDATQPDRRLYVQSS